MKNKEKNEQIHASYYAMSISTVKSTVFQFP
jgi:hypothetical protein